MVLKSFVFGPFAENTYVIIDEETNQGIVVDPGCSNPYEENELKEWIDRQGVKITNVLLTHAHIDHIMGCKFVCDTYKVGISMHKEDLFLLEKAPQIGMMYGFPVKEAPSPEFYVEPGTDFIFGNTRLEVRFTPGHSAGSVTFVHSASKSVVSGDILFKGSIGRTDLPGGNMDILLQSIRSEVFTLADDYVIYSGHGEPTTVGEERLYNPFFK